MRTQGYIIYLPHHKNSVLWSDEALKSGKKYNWNLQLFPGVDGKKETLKDYGLTIYQKNKKCKRYMSRPGTAGCFLSQWQLWNMCYNTNKTIAIYEHDVIFKKPMEQQYKFNDVIKLEGFNKAKPVAGQWWEGARAYLIKPKGAKKIIDWVKLNGAMPADWMLNDGIVDVKFDVNKAVTYKQRAFSFTKDLK